MLEDTFYHIHLFSFTILRKLKSQKCESKSKNESYNPIFQYIFAFLTVKSLNISHLCCKTSIKLRHLTKHFEASVQMLFRKCTIYFCQNVKKLPNSSKNFQIFEKNNFKLFSYWSGKKSDKTLCNLSKILRIFPFFDFGYFFSLRVLFCQS